MPPPIVIATNGERSRRAGRPSGPAARGELINEGVDGLDGNARLIAEKQDQTIGPRVHVGQRRNDRRRATRGERHVLGHGCRAEVNLLPDLGRRAADSDQHLVEPGR